MTFSSHMKCEMRVSERERDYRFNAHIFISYSIHTHFCVYFHLSREMSTVKWWIYLNADCCRIAIFVLSFSHMTSHFVVGTTTSMWWNELIWIRLLPASTFQKNEEEHNHSIYFPHQRVSRINTIDAHEKSSTLICAMPAVIRCSLLVSTTPVSPEKKNEKLEINEWIKLRHTHSTYAHGSETSAA